MKWAAANIFLNLTRAVGKAASGVHQEDVHVEEARAKSPATHT